MTDRRPRVLVVAKHHADDPPSGGVLRLRATIHALAEIAEVRVLAYRERGRPRPRRVGEALAAALASGAPYQVARWETGRLRAAVGRELHRFRPDALHVASPALGRLGPVAGRPAVLDMMDVESAFAAELAGLAGPGRGWWLRREARLFRRLEEEWCASYRSILVSSSREAERAPCRTDVVPNGVVAPSPSPSWERAVPGRVAFAGLMSWWPNVDAARWMVREVLPLLPESVAVDLIGRDPAPEVRALAGHRVRVVGEVEDVAAHLALATAVVVPLRVRAGTRLKVLEGLACARPVVATPEGADGLEELEGEGLVVAGAGAVGLAGAVRDVLQDRSRAERLGRRGRERVEAEHGWDVLDERLRGLYRDRLGLG